MSTKPTEVAGASSKEERSMTTAESKDQIYCVKCKAKTDNTDVEAVTMQNGRPATRATCVDCGTKKFRIGR